MYTHAEASLVDYFISQTKNFSKIDNMFVSNLSEFSDHCSIEISLNIKFESPTEEFRTSDKFCWASADEHLLFSILETKRGDFISSEISKIDQVCEYRKISSSICISCLLKTHEESVLFHFSNFVFDIVHFCHIAVYCITKSIAC